MTQGGRRVSGKILGEAFHYRLPSARGSESARSFEPTGRLARLVHVEGHFLGADSVETNIRFDWSLAGGATMDLGCYPLHMILLFFRPDAARQ